MLIERDFLVKQEKINEQLRQRELERQLARQERGVPGNPFRLGARLIHRILQSSAPRATAGFVEPR